MAEDKSILTISRDEALRWKNHLALPQRGRKAGIITNENVVSNPAIASRGVRYVDAEDHHGNIAATPLLHGFSQLM